MRKRCRAGAYAMSGLSKSVLWVHQGDDDHPHPPRVARLSGRASDGGSRGMNSTQPYAAAGNRAFPAR